MSKLSMLDIVGSVQKYYNAKKKNSSYITIGSKANPPPDYVQAPLPIQKLIGLPGYPLSRMTMISGNPDTGKTTLAMLALASAQKQGMLTILIDTEKKFDFERFKMMGGDAENLGLISCSTVEDGFAGLFNFLDVINAKEENAKVFIVWDSIGGTPSRAEAEKEYGDKNQLAAAAKIIKENLRLLAVRFEDHPNIGLLLINQMYANIGSPGYTNSGGKGPDYHCAIIMQLKRFANHIVTVKGEKYKAGIDTEATITKNHMMGSDKSLYKVKFRVKAYEVQDLSKLKKDEGEESIPVNEDEDSD